MIESMEKETCGCMISEFFKLSLSEKAMAMFTDCLAAGTPHP